MSLVVVAVHATMHVVSGSFLFSLLVSFAASPIRYEALWNVTALQHSHGSGQIFGRLTWCFVIFVLGSSVQILLPATPSTTDFVAKVWALSSGRHLFYNVRFYESFSCLVLSMQIWVISCSLVFLHLCNLPPLTQISLLLLFFFQEMVLKYAWVWVVPQIQICPLCIASTILYQLSYRKTPILSNFKKRFILHNSN